MLFYFLALVVPGFLAVCIALGILSNSRQKVSGAHSARSNYAKAGHGHHGHDDHHNHDHHGHDDHHNHDHHGHDDGHH